MTPPEIHLDDDLLVRLTERAAAHGVAVEEALREAVTSYLDAASSGRTKPATVTLQPLMHVESIDAALGVLALLGARPTQSSASGDWAEVELGGAALSLLAHPPNRAQGDETVELTFQSHGSLDELEASAHARGIDVETPVTEFGFGRQLALRTPDGMRFKINELRSHIE